MKQTKVLIYANIIGLSATIVVNALAVLLPLGGKTTKELSDMYPNLFVPAGITFSIWGLIYLLLIAFVAFQVVDFIKNQEVRQIKRIGWLFIASSIANIAWIFAWQYQNLPISLVAMIALLTSLILLYLKLDIRRGKVTTKVKYFVHLPISIYLGWITVATVANVTALLVAYHWNRFGLSEVFWTITAILITLIITSFMIIIRRDYSYSMVIIWALIGIIIKRSAFNLLTSSYIVLAASISVGILFIMIIFSKLLSESTRVTQKIQ